jgi:hypothetical protein
MENGASYLPLNKPANVQAPECFYLKRGMNMDMEQEIYKLTVEDIFTVIDDSDINIELKESDISFIEDRVGETIDWRSAIETALFELADKKAEKA